MICDTIIPVYGSLLARSDLTRTDVVLYGAIVALDRAGKDPTIADLQRLIGLACERSLRAKIAKLELCGLVKRIAPRKRYTGSKIVPLGPTNGWSEHEKA